MPIRVRNGKLQWRFWINGHEYQRLTDWDDTKLNRTKCLREEAAARESVLNGKGNELRLQIEPFSKAADEFIEWAQGEYSEHPNSWKRLRTSMTSAKKKFGKRPLSGITVGDIEDYKSWRRRPPQQVREITLRHDLHALSLLFQYGKKHDWCKRNLIEETDIPSDKDAVRMNVLSRAAEKNYFDAIERMRDRKLVENRIADAQSLQDLFDLHRLIVLQGCRPEELRCLLIVDVDLESARFTIRKGKSDAAKRTLKMRAESLEILSRRICALTSTDRWVFPSRRIQGKHMGEHQRMQASIIQESGVTCVPYDWRHTFASRAANEENMPLAILAAIMGHANLRSIMKYVHTAQRQMDYELARIDQTQDEFRSGPGPVRSGQKGVNGGPEGSSRDSREGPSKLLN